MTGLGCIVTILILTNLDNMFLDYLYWKIYLDLLVGKIFHLNLKFFILSSQPCKLTDFITGRLNNILMLVIFFGYITFRGKAL